MSRTTQYVGLTRDAQKWVEQAINSTTYDMTTGMFDEVVKGRVYSMPTPAGPNKQLIAREVVQLCPWFSGPMIFTNLELTLIKESGQELPMEHAFSWVFNPSLDKDREYDQERGHYCL